jgi:hypothetical protein
LALVVGVLVSSVCTVLLPRGVQTRLSRVVFTTTRLLFRVRVRPSSSYEVRDRVLAFYGPVVLLTLLLVWVVGVVAGYTAMLWALGAHPWRLAFEVSAASITTLGFFAPHGLPQTIASVTEAGFGLIELALLITFLPNIYGNFHQRELAVTKLRVQAGLPPEGVNIIIRLHNLERLDLRTNLWIEWRDWFTEIEDNHTAFPALLFFRSPVPDYSWVTSAGALLDGAAIATSCLDLPRDLEAELCIRSGYLSLRRIAALVNLPFDPTPAATDPIAIDKSEFFEVWERMASAGVPLRADREQAWRDFAGWRVNYDEPLIRLANLTEAPLAPWSSDRGLVGNRRLTFTERIRR